MSGIPLFDDDDAFPGQRVLLRNELCAFLRMPRTVLAGSGIIVPFAPRPTLFDLTREEWNATFELLREVKTLLDRELAPDGYNVGWNVGAVGGQDIFQAHMHVIPRFADEPMAGRGIRYCLKQAANRRQGAGEAVDA